MGLFIAIPAFGPLILSKLDISYEEGTEAHNILVTMMGVLLISGFILPLIIAFLMKIYPQFIAETKPYAIYIIVALFIALVFINFKRFKRFKLIEVKKLTQNEAVNENQEDYKMILKIDKKIDEYKFRMIIILILIAYISILLSDSLAGYEYHK